MLRSRLLFPLLLILTVAVVGGAFAAYNVFTNAGGSLTPTAPESIIPASADVYVAINRGGGQGDALTHLWDTYRAYPGTQRALDSLNQQACSGGADLSGMNDLLSSFGDQGGMALWMPSDGSAANPQVVAVGQVKVSTILSGNNPLSHNATSVPDTTYSGVQIYRITFKSNGATGKCGSRSSRSGGMTSNSTYGCLVKGDGVLAGDVATLKRVIDVANNGAAALAGDKDYTATMADLPAARALTTYLARSVAARLQHQLDRSYTALPAQTQGALPRIAVRPYALSLAAANDGLSLNTSKLQLSKTGYHVTPNAATTIVGHNAILYSSQDNLAATVSPLLRLVPANQLAQLEQQTGINVQRDILSWMNGEFAMDINDGTSPILTQLASRGVLGSSGSSSSALQSLPGSLEMAWHVDNPSAVQGSLSKLIAVAQKSAHSSAPLFSPVTLPGGASGYGLTQLPGVGYAFKGNWLILSSNLSADIDAIAAPLASDPDYKTALSHASGATTGLSYMSITRLLGAVDTWLGAVNKATNNSMASALSAWTNLGEPLVAPLHSIISSSQTAGGNDVKLTMFMTVSSKK